MRRQKLCIPFYFNHFQCCAFPCTKVYKKILATKQLASGKKSLLYSYDKLSLGVGGLVPKSRINFETTPDIRSSL